MSNYIKKAAAHARLLKLASAARLIRRQRALQKYAQAVQMQKKALGTGATAGIGAGLGGLIGGGIGYGLGKKDKKLLAALIGAGAGAGIGGLGGWGLGAYLNRPEPGTDEALAYYSKGKTWTDMKPKEKMRVLTRGAGLPKDTAKTIISAEDNALPAGSDQLLDQYTNGKTWEEMTPLEQQRLSWLVQNGSSDMYDYGASASDVNGYDND